jgi:hypothetical protein
VKLAYCGREKLFGIFDSLSETNLRVYNPFWVALRNIVSGISELYAINKFKVTKNKI